MAEDIEYSEDIIEEVEPVIEKPKIPKTKTLSKKDLENISERLDTIVERANACKGNCKVVWLVEIKRLATEVKEMLE